MHSAATHPVVCVRPVLGTETQLCPVSPSAAHQVRKVTEELGPMRPGSEHGHWVPIRRAGEGDPQAITSAPMMNPW